MARLIITHSTYIDGLIPVLKKLANSSKIKSITPGVINKAKRRSEGLKIRVSIKTDKGFKLITRNGSQVQEVFIITNLNKEELDELIYKSIN